MKKVSLLVALGASVAMMGTAIGDEAAATPGELPSIMVPIGPDAAEAYWSPDSRYLSRKPRIRRPCPVHAAARAT